jgi:hypothetical protein
MNTTQATRGYAVSVTARALDVYAQMFGADTLDVSTITPQDELTAELAKVAALRRFKADPVILYMGVLIEVKPETVRVTDIEPLPELPA